MRGYTVYVEYVPEHWNTFRFPTQQEAENKVHLLLETRPEGILLVWAGRVLRSWSKKEGTL